MFWGLIMEPNKRYTQTVDKSFHLSMASLDLTRTVGTAPIQVLISLEGSTYLLCTLHKDKTWQMPLDLNFMEGMEISFSCNGQGNVHLTGYLTLEDDTDVLEEEEEDDEDEEGEDDEQTMMIMGKNNKRKPLDLPKGEKDGKRMKAQITEDNEEDDSDLLSQDDDSDEDGLGTTMDDDDEDDDDDEEEDEEESDVEDVKSKPKNQKPVVPNKNQKRQDKAKPDTMKNKPQMANGTAPSKNDQQSKKQKNKKEPQQEQKPQQNEQKKKEVEGGVKIEDLKVGTGNFAKPGKFVSVYYVGRLKNGKKFDATTQGNGFRFKLGRGEVIKGWDVGLSGMKVGGKRRLTIPPAMAYGAKGSPPIIPPHSQLTFEVELKNVE